MIFFVSTPIGNLKDMTFRAVETLTGVDVIACEDTRHSLPLLEHYGIKKPLISYQKFNEAECAEKIIALAEQGKSVAVISDAGTPVLSDPGAVLVKRLIEKDIPFTAVPGANAVLPALILSGLSSERFTFIGFLPEKKSRAMDILEKYSTVDSTLVFYCAPHDLNKTVATLYEALGNRKAVAVKEITKLFETRYEFTLEEGFSGDERGEFVILVGGFVGNEFENLNINEHIALYLNAGMSKMEAVKKVAKERGMPKSKVYKYVLDEEE